MNNDLRFWTDLADGAVMFPIGATMIVLLSLMRQRAAASAWTLAVGGTWAVMLVLKFIGYALAVAAPSSPLSAIDLVTPSGHVASATVIYGGLAGLLLRRPGSLMGRILGAALIAAVGIGITRVLLQEHSISEVIVGAGVGLAGAAILARLARTPVASWVALPILPAVALIMVVRHGVHLSWEEVIHQAATAAVTAWKSGS